MASVNPHSSVEITPSTMLILPQNGDPMLALNLGFGFSNDLDVWTLRPEIGLLMDLGDEGYFVSYSRGLSLSPIR